MEFYEALARDDYRATGRLLDEFFLPYLEIRNRRPGYAVSIVKAGARLVGRDAGPVRPPLKDLLPAELDALNALIGRLGPQ
jgi:5-dehydro-4-deoxyglucarate dehydratase